jgi:hypothetical protein
MKQTNISRSGVIMALALGALAAGIAVFIVAVPRAEMKSSNQTQEAAPLRRVQTSVFGLQTLARNQSLRLSVVNAGLAEPPEPVRTAVVTSLEVRQGNSTVLVVPGTTRAFNPQPDPPRDR